MLFNYLKHQSEGVDVLQVKLKMNGKLDINSFLNSWKAIICKYEIFRISYDLENLQEPVQLISNNIHVDECFQVIDLKSEKEENFAIRLAFFIESDRKTEINLSTPPLMRFSLLLISDEEYVFLWTVHHSIIDGRAINLVLKDINETYNRLLNGEKVDEIRNKEFTTYLEWLTNKSWQEEEGFWRKYLNNLNFEDTHLSNGLRSKTAKKIAIDYIEHNTKISNKTQNEIRLFSQEHNITPNTFFLGVWAFIQNIYVRKDKVLFGVIRACRYIENKKFKSTIGPLLNILPFRVDISSNINVVEWLQYIRQNWVTLREFESTPASKIREWMNSGVNNELFDNLMVFSSQHPNSSSPFSFIETNVEILRKSSYPLSFYVFWGEAVEFKLMYDENIIDSNLIDTIADDIKFLIHTFLRNPKTDLKDLPLCPTQDSQLRLIGNISRYSMNNEHHLLQSYFENVVPRYPNHLAIRDELEEMTYEELDKNSNRVAHYLRSIIMKKEAFICLYLEPSVKSTIALLGTLKAGFAYVPIDPEIPIERANYIISNVNAALVIIEDYTPKKLAENNHCLIIDDLVHKSIMFPCFSPKELLEPDTPAYVIYTSGSTGTPKGVVCTHQGATNLLHDFSNRITAIPQENYSQWVNWGFDLSILEIFTSLSWAGTLHIVPRNFRKDPLEYATWIRQNNINQIIIPPIFVPEFVEISRKESFKSLRRVICGGESVPSRQFRQLIKLNKGLEVYYGYGPTETTIGSTFFDLHEDDGFDEYYSTSIGKPVNNTVIMILDDNRKLVPVGVIGEMYIGGIGLAQGYVGNEELTEEKFIEISFPNISSQKMYKTGDLGYYLPDGNIQFCGRRDKQIKIHGFRIELEEIENVILGFPSVIACVVFTIQHLESSQIVAFVVQKGINLVSAEEIREKLLNKLPYYMVPSKILNIDQVPVNHNSKVDYVELQRWIPSESKEKEISSDNYTDTQKIVWDIWRKVLNLDTISIHDNFFELGGHSILVMQVIRELRDIFGVTISFQEFYLYPTIDLIDRIIKDKVNEAIELMSDDEVKQILKHK